MNPAIKQTLATACCLVERLDLASGWLEVCIFML